MFITTSFSPPVQPERKNCSKNVGLLPQLPTIPYYSKLISTITTCKGILFPCKDHNHRTGKGEGHRTESTRETIDTGTTQEEKKNDTEGGAEGRQNKKTQERIDWKKTQRKKNRQREYRERVKRTERRKRRRTERQRENRRPEQVKIRRNREGFPFGQQPHVFIAIAIVFK